jgi:hypothetical protein
MNRRFSPWVRIVSAIVAVLLFCLTPLVLTVVLYTPAHEDPVDVFVRLIALLIPPAGLLFSWLALDAPVFRRSLERHPLWARVVSGILATLLLLISPYAVLLALGSFYGRTFSGIAMGVICCVYPLAGLLFAWFALGLPVLRHSPQPHALWLRVLSALIAVGLLGVSPRLVSLALRSLIGIDPDGTNISVAVGDIIFGLLCLLVPLAGALCAGLALGLKAAFGPPPHDDSGALDDAYTLFEQAVRMERKGEVREALQLYGQIATQYSHTVAAQDALASIRHLRSQIG